MCNFSMNFLKYLLRRNSLGARHASRLRSMEALRASLFLRGAIVHHGNTDEFRLPTTYIRGFLQAKKTLHCPWSAPIFCHHSRNGLGGRLYESRLLNSFFPKTRKQIRQRNLEWDKQVTMNILLLRSGQLLSPDPKLALWSALLRKATHKYRKDTKKTPFTMTKSVWFQD